MAQYFKSNDIKVFPCTYRGKKADGTIFNPEAKLTTELNYTLLSKLGGGFDRASYIIGLDNNIDNSILKVVLGGYYFEINLTTYQEILNGESGKATNLHIELVSKKIVGDTAETKILKDLNTEDNNHNSLDTEIEGEYYFVGLSYSIDNAPKTTVSEDSIYLTIFNDGKLCYNNFLPKLNTLSNDTRGLVVNDLEIIDEDEAESSLNSTATWLNKHTKSSSPALTINPINNNSGDEKNANTLNFDLGLKNGAVVKGINNMEVIDNTTVLGYGYYPVENVREVDGINPDKVVLAVNIPNKNSWRSIKVNGAQLLDTTVNTNNSLNIKADPNSTIVLDVNKTNNELIIGNKYINPSYTTGLLLGAETGGGNNHIYVPYANTDNAGVSKVHGKKNVTLDNGSNSTRNYGVWIDENYKLYVNVPWKNYDEQINSLQKKLDELIAKPTVPWTDNPRVSIYYTNGTQVLEDILTDDLSSYIVRVYHNRDTAITSNASIRAYTKNNILNLELKSNNSQSSYAEYYIRSINDANLYTGELVEDVFSFNIDYKNNLGASVGDKYLVYDASFEYEKLTAINPFTDAPEIKLYSVAADGYVNTGYVFRDYSDIRIRVFPHLNTSTTLYNNKSNFYVNNKLEEYAFNETADTSSPAIYYTMSLLNSQIEGTNQYTDNSNSYIEYEIEPKVNYTPEGSIALLVRFDLTFESKNTELVTNEYVSVGLSIKLNTPIDYKDCPYCTNGACGTCSGDGIITETLPEVCPACQGAYAWFVCSACGKDVTTYEYRTDEYGRTIKSAIGVSNTCPNGHNTGAVNSTAEVGCKNCGAMGYLYENMTEYSRQCPDCSGKGGPCHNCNGSGSVAKNPNYVIKL